MYAYVCKNLLVIVIVVLFKIAWNYVDVWNKAYNLVILIQNYSGAIPLDTH
jgi:hypothetical protein